MTPLKKKEKIYNFWKRDFLKVVTTFDVGLTKAHTFEELENFAKKKRLKSLKLTSK